MAPTLNLGILASGVSLAAGIKGPLWAWGFNSEYQLGDGTATNRTSPVRVGSDSDWAAISAGGKIDPNDFFSSYYGFSHAIKENGKLYAWGYNADYQLGDGTTTRRTAVTQIGSDTNWKSVSLGDDFGFAIKTDGKLFSWGSNGNGATGQGTTSGTTNSPTQIGSASDWAQVSAGLNHALAIKTNGTLYAWGLNSTGQLGDNTTTQRTSPVQIGSDTDWALVAAGENHTLAIKTNGKLYAWGSNTAYQLGDGTVTQRNSPVQIGSDTDWAKVKGIQNASLAIKTNGKLYAWGSNSAGKTGQGTASGNTTTPTQIGSDTDWKEVSGGRYNSQAIKTNGKLYGWGENSYGHIGDGTTTNRTAPVQIGSATDWQGLSSNTGPNLGSTHAFGIRT